MNGRKEPNPAEPPAPAGDAEFAEGYIQGYAEGLREGLRELLQHASQGHTTAELRVLVKSRISRIPEDVELKRRHLLAPPRRSSWEPLLKPPPRSSGGTALSDSAGPQWAPGKAFLFREERPRAAVRFAQAQASHHTRALWISFEAPPPLGLGEGAVEWLRPSVNRPGDPEAGSGSDPGAIAGRIKERGSDPPLLVYLDALEELRTQYGNELTLRFASWLGQWVAGSDSTVVASLDDATLAEPERRRLQRSFHILA
ncbi:MAG: DUF835 domain-containing protein [Thermoplasmata archaeon]|nr:DUF835 domain-containing protein [Thermoplasmata archaeon]